MKNLFFSLFLPLRPFEIFFFFFQPSEPRRKEDFKQPQIQKKTKQEVFHLFWELQKDKKKILKHPQRQKEQKKKFLMGYEGQKEK